MKKFLKVLTPLTLAAAVLLTGCGGDGTSPGDTADYTLTFSVNDLANGTLSAALPDGTMVKSGQLLPSGTVVTLTITPAGAAMFDRWQGAGDGSIKGDGSSASPFTITMDKDKSIEAVFSSPSDQTHSLTLNGAANGNTVGAVYSDGSSIADLTIIPRNAAIIIRAEPVSDYLFTGWIGDFSGAADSVRLTMDSD